MEPSFTDNTEKSEKWVVNLIIKYGENDNIEINRKRNIPTFSLDSEGSLVKKRRFDTKLRSSGTTVSSEMILFVLREKNELLSQSEINHSVDEKMLSGQFICNKSRKRWVSREKLDEMVEEETIDEIEREEDGIVMYELLEKGKLHLKRYLKSEEASAFNSEEYTSEGEEFTFDSDVDLELQMQNFQMEKQMYAEERKRNRRYRRRKPVREDYSFHIPEGEKLEDIFTNNSPVGERRTPIRKKSFRFSTMH